VRALQDGQRQLLELLRVAPPAGGTVPPAGGGGVDVAALVARAVDAARAAERLADLPAAYRRLMPATGSADDLAAAEQAIRRQYRDDLSAAGRTLAGGGPAPAAGGVSPAAAPVDLSKLSGLALITMGLKAGTPTRGG
jgi:hypothetical protein